eukprot:3884653-Rhodomonas_salina.2
MEHVLDAMDFAVHAHDVKHVILDNLQCLSSGPVRLPRSISAMCMSPLCLRLKDAGANWVSICL